MEINEIETKKDLWLPSHENLVIHLYGHKFSKTQISILHKALKSRKLDCNNIMDLYTEPRHFKNGLRVLVAKGFLNREYRVVWPSDFLLNICGISNTDYWDQDNFVLRVESSM